jgi:hypothetical protein
VAVFSGSLLATRATIANFSPTFLTFARVTIAALWGLMLLLSRQPANISALVITA